MATITKRQAVDRLTEAIRKARPDDLVEIHNELFPEKPTTDIDNGLEVEEILDLWHVIFPKHRTVWFEEEEGLLHYAERIEQVSQAE